MLGRKSLQPLYGKGGWGKTGTREVERSRVSQPVTSPRSVRSASLLTSGIRLGVAARRDFRHRATRGITLAAIAAVSALVARLAFVAPESGSDAGGDPVFQLLDTERSTHGSRPPLAPDPRLMPFQHRRRG